MAEINKIDSVLGLEVDHRGFVSEQDRDEFFRHQLSLPENSVCFDCGFANPKWTSVSFSIYLCLNCSGRHRQMGSHISFVRSVDMDRFTRDQLLRLTLGGNGEFTTFLCSENLLKKPLKYDDKTILSYPGKLDVELAKYRKISSKPDSDLKDPQESVVDEKLSSNTSLEPSVTLDSLDSVKSTSQQSSVRDDVEKLSKPPTETVVDLLDLRSISSDDMKNTVPVAELKITEDVPKTPTQKKEDGLDPFGTFDCSHNASSSCKFDSFSEFVTRPVDSSVRTDTKDSMLNLEGIDMTPSFGTDSFKTPTTKPTPLPRPNSTRVSRNKFSSKATNFDFEDFEKQNTLQSYHSADSDPVPSVPSDSYQTPSPGQKVVTPVLLSPGLTKSPDLKPTHMTSPILQPKSSPLSTNPHTANKEVLSDKLQRKPDISQFKGKSSISSDAFFGTNEPVVANQVSPNSQAFSSDDYFGRPRQESTHVPTTLEEQAIHNLNELKDNIVSAINRGTVLFEKAKNWIYTNYNQY